MQGRGKRIIALILCAMMLLTSIPFDVDNVFAATYNVEQSRRSAEIEEFPASYQLGLKRVKETYPNAQFVYYDTGLDWYEDVLTKDGELAHGINLIPSSSPSSWKSHDLEYYDPTTNTYKQVEPRWNQASEELVAYYMDPRNFFNERDVFQFLNLAFDGSQTLEGTQAVIKGSFMDNKTIVDNEGNEITYAEALYEIGKAVGVSPYLLACRIRQEQGGVGAMISGNYEKVPGYYNYFNIYASGSTTELILTRGLEYAKSRGWDTPYKSIYGGSQFLVNNYVSSGKNCLYLQHFNMTARNGVVDYSVYMANTLAPYTENRMMTASFNDNNAAYTFIIPVYNNMPENPCEMPEGNGNGSYVLESLSLDNGEINIGEFDPYTYSYKAIANDVSLISINATTYSTSTKIAINGIEVDMAGSTVLERFLTLNKGFNDIILTVTAENGLCRDYVIEVINNDEAAHFRGKTVKMAEEVTIKSGTSVSALKADIETLNCIVLVTDGLGTIKGNEDICIPGDIVIVKSKDNKLAYSAPITINGDVSGDGYVTYEDVEIACSHILEACTLTLEERKLADMNVDGEITIEDLYLIKLLTDEEIPEYNAEIEIELSVPSGIYKGKQNPITLLASNGTYFAEGYLTYDEGKVFVSGIDNSGKIHFVIDGGYVMFENGRSKVDFETEMRNGSVNFGVEIVRTFDYTTKEEFEIEVAPKIASMNNSELEVTIQLNDAITEGDGKTHSATLNLTNTSSMSIGHISVVLGEHFANNKEKQVVELMGIAPGESQSVDLYLVNNLSSGKYQSEFKISYQDSKCVESLVLIPIQFEVQNHEHEEDWQFNNKQHYASCKTCNTTEYEDHIYKRTDNGIYECCICGFVKTLNLTIEQNESIMGRTTTYTPSLVVNDEIIALASVDIQWYVDGKKDEKRSVLSKWYQSVGYKNVDCVVTMPDGLVVAATVVTYVSPVPTNSIHAIAVEKLTCDSITLVRHDGYEYKIGNGKWQMSPVFIGLTAGKEYSVYKRQIGRTTDVEHLQIVPSHNTLFSNKVVDMCGKDLATVGKCKCCGITSTKTFQSTAKSHVFINYEVAQEATCQTGTIEKSKCVYGGCEMESTRALTDKQYHSFSVYTYDNNATCVNGGTSTAVCDYGCGTSDVVPVEVEVFGHEYEYVSNDDATIETGITETGTCKNCSETNVRVIDGTRLRAVTEISIELSSASTQRSDLPTATSLTDGMSVVEIVWKNSNGDEFKGDTEDVVIKNDETYQLTSLVISADKEHYFADGVALYVNGNRFVGDGNVADNTITFTDVGQFVFKAPEAAQE